MPTFELFSIAREAWEKGLALTKSSIEQNAHGPSTVLGSAGGHPNQHPRELLRAFVASEGKIRWGE